jgi:hypothetical protein
MRLTERQDSLGSLGENLTIMNNYIGLENETASFSKKTSGNQPITKNKK